MKYFLRFILVISLSLTPCQKIVSQSSDQQAIDAKAAETRVGAQKLINEKASQTTIITWLSDQMNSAWNMITSLNQSMSWGNKRKILQEEVDNPAEEVGIEEADIDYARKEFNAEAKSQSKNSEETVIKIKSLETALLTANESLVKLKNLIAPSLQDLQTKSTNQQVANAYSSLQKSVDILIDQFIQSIKLILADAITVNKMIVIKDGILSLQPMTNNVSVSSQTQHIRQAIENLQVFNTASSQEFELIA